MSTAANTTPTEPGSVRDTNVGFECLYELLGYIDAEDLPEHLKGQLEHWLAKTRQFVQINRDLADMKKSAAS